MLKVSGLEFSYGTDKKILQEVSFDVLNGECVAILGNNGAGKSTMLKCLNKIISPHKGTVVVNQVNILKLSGLEIAQKTAYVAQKNEVNQISAYDAILLGRKPYVTFSPTKKDHLIVERILQNLHLEELSLRSIDELSGGELQKVMIGRALAQEPKVLLLDEPTSCLDLHNQLEVLKLIQKITKEKEIAVVIVLHDLNLALRYCDKFLYLKNSQVYSYGDIETVTSRTISDVYGVDVEIVERRDMKIVIPY